MPRALPVIPAFASIIAAAAGVGGFAPLAAGSEPERPARPAAAATPAAPRPDVDPRAVTLDRLQRRVTVELNGNRLEEVVRFIADFAGADIDARWSDSGAGGLDPDKPITLSVKELPALALLERILSRAGGADAADAATWQMAETGAIEIGPRSILNRSATFRMYDVRDLLFEVPNFTNVPQLDLEQVLNQSSGGGGGGGNVVSQYEAAVEGPTERELADKLVSIITSTIEPAQWRQNGGDGASIEVHNGALLVSAPDYIHRQLAGYPYWANRPMRDAQAAEYRAAMNERETKRREALAAPANTPATTANPGAPK